MQLVHNGYSQFNKDSPLSSTQILLFSIGLVVLLLLAAFFSCVETALLSLNRYRLRHLTRQRQRYAMRLTALLARPDRLLGTVLIGNTFANMLASSLATLLAYHFFGEHGALLAAIVLTIIVLIFAEITPKTIAALYPEHLARWLVWPVDYVMKLLYPLVWITNGLTNSLLHLFGIHVKAGRVEPLTREELRSIVYDTTGKLSRRYQNMLLSILDLNKLTVDDIMLPRHEMQGIDITAPLDTLIKALGQLSLTHIPVYQEQNNQVIGVLDAGELFKLLLVSTPMNKAIIEQCMVKPCFVPSKTALTAQFHAFQHSQDKLVFVVDEYGDILGLLTLDDILEEIIGDLTLGEGKRIKRQKDGSYLVEGGVLVREFNRATGWELPQHGPRTINGLIIEYLQMLPQVGTSVLIADYPIEIKQIKDNHVRLARISPLYNGN